MKKIICFGIVPFILSLFAFSGQTDAFVGMVTGSETGTYFQFGKDIANLCKNYGLDIQVKKSEGSLDNIERMESRENAAFGIVQSDVLGVLYLQKPEVAKKLRMIYPLYNEEVHILARKEITSFEDLDGKTIASGTRGSGNWLTLACLLQKMRVKPARQITDLKPLDALVAVLEGKVDAMIYVAGKPVKLFSKMDQLYKEPKFKPLIDNVHFIAMNDPEMLKEYYVSSTLNPTDYDWMREKTPTIAVKALLVSFDFSGSQNAYYQERCRQLKSLSAAIRDNLYSLKKNGHEKWQDVNLETEIGRWNWDVCAHPAKTGQKKVDLYDTLQKMFE